MSNRLSCKEIQALLFELQRGELSNLKGAEVDEHLRHCKRCRELVMKSGDLFDAARDGDAEMWADIDPDLVFDRVEAELGGEFEASSSDEFGRLGELFETTRQADRDTWANVDSDALFDRISEQVVEPSGVNEDTEEPTAVRTTRLWRVAALGAVAAAVAAIFAWWGMSTDEPSPVAPESIEVAEQAPAQPAESEESDAGSAAVAEAEDRLSPAMSLPSMKPAASKHDAVQLFGSEDVDYDFVEDDHHGSVDLNRGSMLVEYLPGSESRFSMRARSHTITVVGTVFFVDIEDDKVSVAVFEGAVEVTGPDGVTRKLESGQYVSGDDDGSLAEELTSQLVRYVDLELHRQALREAASSADPAPAEPAEVAAHAEAAPADHSTERSDVEAGVAEDVEVDKAEGPEIDEAEGPEVDEAEGPEVDEIAVDETAEMPRPASSRELREKALEAFHQREYRHATDLLAEALDKTAPTDRTSADILLELARIHLRELDEPQKAADYLRRFVEHWPDDPAAETISKQLCDMDAVDSSDDMLCQ